jgi:hypothetical protein
VVALQITSRHNRCQAAPGGGQRRRSGSADNLPQILDRGVRTVRGETIDKLQFRFVSVRSTNQDRIGWGRQCTTASSWQPDGGGSLCPEWGDHSMYFGFCHGGSPRMWEYRGYFTGDGHFGVLMHLGCLGRGPNRLQPASNDSRGPCSDFLKTLDGILRWPVIDRV